MCICWCVDVSAHISHGGNAQHGESTEQRTTSKCLLTSHIASVFYIKTKMETDAWHWHTDKRTHSRCWEYFFFSEGSAASRLGGDKSQALDSCGDIFRGLCKPAAFTLFPYGDIHQHFLEVTHAQRRASGVLVHGANYIRCCSSNFCFCAAVEEPEMWQCPMSNYRVYCFSNCDQLPEWSRSAIPNHSFWLKVSAWFESTNWVFLNYFMDFVEFWEVNVSSTSQESPAT